MLPEFSFCGLLASNIGYNPKHMKSKKAITGIRIWAVWNMLCSALCLVRTARVGERSLNSLLFGYSASRLLIMAAIFLFFLISLYVMIRVDACEGFFCRTCVKPLALIGAWLAAAVFIVMGFMLSPSVTPYFRRVAPLLVCLCSFGLSTAILSQQIRNERKTKAFTGLLRRMIAYFCIAAVILVLVFITGIGIVPDSLDWQPVGMAVRTWEVGFAFLAAILLLFLLRRLPERFKDAAIFLLLWIGTAVFWVSIPTMKVLNHSFFMEIAAPDQLPYPVSDCAGYGVWAESVLAGLGFKTAIATRQLFILILAAFLALTKGDILQTINCMTVLTALIPPCLYLVGKRLHSREAGLFAALLAVWREYNTLYMASLFMTSNSKMWLTDLPAALFMIVLTICCIDSLNKPRSAIRVVLAGCFAGLACTLRSQFYLILIVPILFYLTQKAVETRVRIRSALIFLACSIMVVAPWLIRGKILTGSIVFDDPAIHSAELARRFSDTGESGEALQSDESMGDYSARNKQHMLNFLREKPGYVLRFIASHFMNNEISALCVLPFGTDAAGTIRNVTDSDYQDAAGRLFSVKDLPALADCLLMLSLGVAAARKRCGAAGILPFVMCTVYLFFTACGRYSGWRFALPADWITLTYFAIGCFEAVFRLFDREGSLTAGHPELQSEPHRPVITICVLAVFFICGLLPVVIGDLIPNRIPERTTEENLALLPSNEEVLNGRMLYPMFFYRGEGISGGHPWPPYAVRDYPRLGFILLNEENTYVVLPMKEIPGKIGNGEDVVVSGHYEDDLFIADAVLFEESGRMLTSESFTF